MTRWAKLAQWWCLWTTRHRDAVYCRDGARLYTQCPECGYESPGVEVAFR